MYFTFCQDESYAVDFRLELEDFGFFGFENRDIVAEATSLIDLNFLSSSCSLTTASYQSVINLSLNFEHN